jgi:hypothetical protein
MVDLQRPIRGIWNIVRATKQDGRENSNAAASAKSVLGEKFSDPDSPGNFIRADLS